MADEHCICLFCHVEGGILKKSERLQSIRDASQQRRDNLHLSLQDNTSFIWCHSNCLSTYCSKHHISRHLKRCSGADGDSLPTDKLGKRPRRQDNHHNNLTSPNILCVLMLQQLILQPQCCHFRHQLPY